MWFDKSTDIHCGREYAGIYSLKSVLTENCWCDLENRLVYLNSDVLRSSDQCIFELIPVIHESDHKGGHAEMISCICLKFIF